MYNCGILSEENLSSFHRWHGAFHSGLSDVVLCSAVSWLTSSYDCNVRIYFESEVMKTSVKWNEKFPFDHSICLDSSERRALDLNGRGPKFNTHWDNILLLDIFCFYIVDPGAQLDRNDRSWVLFCYFVQVNQPFQLCYHSGDRTRHPQKGNWVNVDLYQLRLGINTTEGNGHCPPYCRDLQEVLTRLSAGICRESCCGYCYPSVVD